MKTKKMWISLEDLRINGIKLRFVDGFYLLSKTCHHCGCVKSDLKLSDRIYVCSNFDDTADRDFNASLNSRDCQTYQIA